MNIRILFNLSNPKIIPSFMTSSNIFQNYQGSAIRLHLSCVQRPMNILLSQNVRISFKLPDLQMSSKPREINVELSQHMTLFLTGSLNRIPIFNITEEKIIVSHFLKGAPVCKKQVKCKIILFNCQACSSMKIKLQIICILNELFFSIIMRNHNFH